MSSNTLWFVCLLAGLTLVGFLAWKMTSRSAYESAEYQLLSKDGSFEVREYPALWMATTDMQTAGREDGSFMRLFRYISGDNQRAQKVSMTTPVFMASAGRNHHRGQMGFVMPRQLSDSSSIPAPENDRVSIRQRASGKYAVIRFSGRAGNATIREMECLLRDWMDEEGLVPNGQPELAGYDPPWTPGPLRRNEILIRVGE